MENGELIHLKDITVCLEENIILRNASLTLRNGEFVYVIGKVGSGKSSLLKSLYCEIPIIEGQATIMDYDLRTMKTKDIPFLRRKLGIVFQDFQLLIDRSVTKNLEFVLKATGWTKKDDIEKRIDDVLEQVGMSNKGYKMPHELSGGEQQRVAIAIALANKPSVLLADEPTGAVDSKTSASIMELFDNLCKELGVTIVVVSHDQIISKYVNRVVSIRDGKTSSEILRTDMISNMENLASFKEEHLELAIVDRSGRVQLPAELLEKLSIESKSKVHIDLEDKKIVIHPVDVE